MSSIRFIRGEQRGTTMLEVLVTIIILAFGMLGLAGLQSKMHLAEVESYQRGQAVLLMSDMAERIGASIDASSSNPTAAGYVTTALNPPYLGTGDTQPASCTALTVGTAARDRCEWSNALKGAAEAQTPGASVGAMIGARGCVEQLQAPNPAAGVCTPGIYRVTVTWQGMNTTVAPGLNLTCGSGLYGAAALQRAISANVTVGMPQCS